MQISEIRSDVPIPVEKEIYFPLEETLKKLKLGDSFEITGVSNAASAETFAEMVSSLADLISIMTTIQYGGGKLTIWRTA